MIYTQYGEPVTIIGRTLVSPMPETVCVVRSVNDKSWVREYRVWQLRADRGTPEVIAAVNALRPAS